MMSALARVRAIAWNTLVEALRQRVLNVIFLFGVVLVCGANFLTDLSFQDEFKFLKDLGYAAISITGFLVALIGAAQLIPAEIERRTLYTMLSKPVRRVEFIIGKYLGLLSLITVMLAIMSVMFMGVMYYQEQSQLAELAGHGAGEEVAYARQQILEQSRDPGMIQAVLLIWAKMAVVTAISVFFSTIATSTIFIVCTTVVVYITGHLQSVAKSVWLGSDAGAGIGKNLLLMVISFLIPDLQAYDLIDEIIAGNSIHWTNTCEILVFSVVYVVVTLIISSLIFEDREL